jgi:hypothetical protein
MSPLLVAGLLGADSIEEPVTTNLLTLWLSFYAAASRGCQKAIICAGFAKCRVRSTNVSACCREPTAPAASHGSAQRRDPG